MEETFIINGSSYKAEGGLTYARLWELYSKNKAAPRPLAAMEDGRLRELNEKASPGANIEFIDIFNAEGKRIYVRTLSFIFVRAVKELFPKALPRIEHSLGNALYCEIEGDFALTEEHVAQAEQRMREIVASDEPFVKTWVTKEEAIDYYTGVGFVDKARLLRYRKRKTFTLYENGGLRDYFYGFMAPSTGYVDVFALRFQSPGLVIILPETANRTLKLEYEERPKLFSIFRESTRWARILECDSVSDLNAMVEGGKLSEFAAINEALHEKKIAEIADMICNNPERQLILIAGPSSSGKTTFANRLAIQLRVNGKRPVSISLDNYYLDRELVPLDEFGAPDLENISALDVQLFNEQLGPLLSQQEVELPLFSFLTGKREPKGMKLRVPAGEPILVEGIHGLNPALTEAVPGNRKFGIYVSALTQLNLDIHNRIPTTDVRLVRRMVRDFKFRGSSAEQTFIMWPSVLRGERKYIFPYQENADVMFNSTLVYEMVILKKYAYPLIKAIEDGKFALEAGRMRKFLNYFLETEDESFIPPTSILREFIGGCVFYC